MDEIHGQKLKECGEGTLCHIGESSGEICAYVSQQSFFVGLSRYSHLFCGVNCVNRPITVIE